MILALLVIAIGELQDIERLVTLILFAVVAVTAVPILRSRRKDAIIKVLEADVRARASAMEALSLQLEGASTRADEEHEKRRECEREISRLQGQCDELAKFTAPEAFRVIADRLVTVETAVVTAIQSQGELVMKNTELMASLNSMLEKFVQEYT